MKCLDCVHDVSCFDLNACKITLVEYDSVFSVVYFLTIRFIVYIYLKLNKIWIINCVNELWHYESCVVNILYPFPLLSDKTSSNTS